MTYTLNNALVSVMLVGTDQDPCFQTSCTVHISINKIYMDNMEKFSLVDEILVALSLIKYRKSIRLLFYHFSFKITAKSISTSTKIFEGVRRFMHLKHTYNKSRGKKTV